MSEKPIERMTFDELRKEVQLQRDELTRLKRSYEDAIYNIGTDNFDKKFVVEQDNMKSQIRVAADEISTAVSQIYNEAIYTIVKPGDPAHPDHTFNIDNLYYYTGDGCYYYYNNISKKWKKSDSMCIFSQFKQTSDGFELKGDVKINGDLNGCGGTFTGDIVADTFIATPTDSTVSLVMRAKDESSQSAVLHDVLKAYTYYDSNTDYFLLYIDHGTKIQGSSYKVVFDFNILQFGGNVDFSHANVDGLHAVFA